MFSSKNHFPKKRKNERGKMGKELQVLSDNNSLNIHIFNNISSHYVMSFLINQLLIFKKNSWSIYISYHYLYIYGLLQFLMHEYYKYMFLLKFCTFVIKVNNTPICFYFCNFNLERYFIFILCFQLIVFFKNSWIQCYNFPSIIDS